MDVDADLKQDLESMEFLYWKKLDKLEDKDIENNFK